MYMTSCFSGHWAETTAFQGDERNPKVLSAEKEQGFLDFMWSNLQRHVGGLFLSATLKELLDVDSNTMSGASLNSYYNSR